MSVRFVSASSRYANQVGMQPGLPAIPEPTGCWRLAGQSQNSSPLLELRVHLLPQITLTGGTNRSVAKQPLRKWQDAD